MPTKPQSHSIDSKALSRIYGNGRGWSFSQADFADLGLRGTIDSSLHRLRTRGQIRSVIRGIYDYPKYSEILVAPLSPDLDQVANAIARKFGWRIQPDGVTAQNLMGLTTQVPAQILYLSDGPTRNYKNGHQSLRFKHTVLKEAGFKLRESRLVVQALKAFGEEHVTSAEISHLRRLYPQKLRRAILRDAKTATGWVYAAIQKIAQDAPDA